MTAKVSHASGVEVAVDAVRVRNFEVQREKDERSMKRKTLTIVAMTVALLTTGQASAVWVSYPGTTCATAHNSPVTGSYLAQGNFVNESSAGKLIATCPTETNSTNPYVRQVRVTVYDLNDGPDDARDNVNNVMCWFTERWTDAQGRLFGRDSGLMETTGSLRGPQVLSATAGLGVYGNNTQFECFVPARSSFGRSSIFNQQVNLPSRE